MACFSYNPLNPEVGQTVNFDASCSSDPDNDSLDYSWNFGDGYSDSGASVSHSYSSEGAYQVTLTVTDSNGAFDSTIANIFVSSSGGNHSPTACFTCNPLNPEVGQTVNFDASCSSDPDNDSLDYSWNFGDGYSDKGIAVSHSYPSSGAYEVTLIVDDGQGGTDSTSQILYVGQAPPQVDLSIVEVKPVQVLEEFLGDSGRDFFDNNMYDLIAGKATAVKVVVESTGPATTTVKIKFNGVDYGWYHEYFYLFDEVRNNNDFKWNDNERHRFLKFDSAGQKIIYFFPCNPYVSEKTGGEDDIYAIVDWENSIGETNEENNRMGVNGFKVWKTEWDTGTIDPKMKIRYFPVDFKYILSPNDNGNLDFRWYLSYYNSSSIFLRDVYPISENDFDRRRYDSIYSSGYVPISGKILMVMEVLKVKFWLADPEAGVYVAAVPEGWFSENLFGNIRGFSSWLIDRFVLVECREQFVAHEVGHRYGLRSPIWSLWSSEEYDINPPYGNIVYNGLWVNEKMIMDSNLWGNIYCFMGSKTDWVCYEDFEKLFKDHLGGNKTRKALENIGQQKGVIYISGYISKNDEVELRNWYRILSGALSTLQLGDYSVQCLDASGDIIFQQSFQVSFTTAYGESVDKVPFSFTIPYIQGTKRVQIKHNETVLAERIVSDYPPVVSVISPNGGEIARGTVRIQWNATDADADDLSYAVLFSADGGETWNTLAIDLKENYYVWNTSELEEGNGYIVKVIATDSVNTGIDVSDAVFSVRKSISSSSDFFVDKNKMMRPLASTHISQAEFLKEKTYSLLQEAVGKSINVSEVQAMIEKADELLAGAKKQYLSGNYIAANYLALKASELYQQIIEALETLLE